MLHPTETFRRRLCSARANLTIPLTLQPAATDRDICRSATYKCTPPVALIFPLNSPRSLSPRSLLFIPLLSTRFCRQTTTHFSPSSLFPVNTHHNRSHGTFLTAFSREENSGSSTITNTRLLQAGSTIVSNTATVSTIVSRALAVIANAPFTAQQIPQSSSEGQGYRRVRLD